MIRLEGVEAVAGDQPDCLYIGESCCAQLGGHFIYAGQSPAAGRRCSPEIQDFNSEISSLACCCEEQEAAGL